MKGIRDVTKVTASSGNALALTNKGEVWIWGDNGIGQIGDGTNTVYDEYGYYILEDHERTSPFKFPGLNDIVNVQTSSFRNFYAIDKSGQLWAWGNNMYGMIGDGRETVIDPRNISIIYNDNNRTTAFKIMTL